MEWICSNPNCERTFLLSADQRSALASGRRKRFYCTHACYGRYLSVTSPQGRRYGEQQWQAFSLTRNAKSNQRRNTTMQTRRTMRQLRSAIVEDTPRHAGD